MYVQRVTKCQGQFPNLVVVDSPPPSRQTNEKSFNFPLYYVDCLFEHALYQLHMERCFCLTYLNKADAQHTQNLEEINAYWRNQHFKYMYKFMIIFNTIH